jgi:glycolate oxidase FAD binding subunit
VDLSPTLVRGLREAVGREHVVEGPAAAAWTVDGLVPAVVVRPGRVEEVARCLAVAAEGHLAVAPTGQGTRRAWGGVPRRLDLVLALDRLDRVTAHTPEDLTMSAEAGCPLGVLQAVVRDHNQHLPLDPSHAASSTIGGLIATGAAGPYRGRYGTMRELLLGVTVIQGDGTLVRGGGRVVKNATGYDMPKVHVGALGTLGVVVEAHLRLHPRPAAEGTWVFGYPSLEAAVSSATALRDTTIEASRLELLDGGMLGRLGVDAAPAAALAVGIGSVPEAVRAQGARLGEVCRATGGTLLAESGAELEWWQTISDQSWPPDPASLTFRVGVRPTDVAAACRAVEEPVRATPGSALRVTAELAGGVIHAVVTRLPPGAAADLVRRARDGLGPLDGTLLVEHAPAGDKPGLDVWGEVGPALDAMRRLKAELDPAAALNPGRFVGGI